MADFLNTSKVTYCLEELIKKARKRIILISPYLRFNKRIRELIEDKARAGVQVHVVYGKRDLKQSETDWLRSLSTVVCSYCENLHAKCYLSESYAIITSMNLYEFSQVNNNEMGVFIRQKTDEKLFRETSEEAERLIRISDEATLSQVPATQSAAAEETGGKKISTTQLAKKSGCSTKQMFSRLLDYGLVVRQDDSWKLTPSGVAAGGAVRQDNRFGEYIIWPENLALGPLDAE